MDPSLPVLHLLLRNHILDFQVCVLLNTLSSGIFETFPGHSLLHVLLDGTPGLVCLVNSLSILMHLNVRILDDS